MSKSKTRLQHTCPTEVPFDCMTGDFSDQGFLIVVDKRTHELLVRDGAEAGTLTVIVNPKGVEVKGVSTRPGTRALDITPSSSAPMRQAAESIERLRREQFTGPADYFTAALTRLRDAADTQDFDVGEVTLCFDVDEWEVRLKVELSIAADRLDHTPAPGGAIGAPPGRASQHVSPEEG